jgi:hypothetical protein
MESPNPSSTLSAQGVGRKIESVVRGTNDIGINTRLGPDHVILGPLGLHTLMKSALLGRPATEISSIHSTDAIKSDSTRQDKRNSVRILPLLPRHN